MFYRLTDAEKEKVYHKNQKLQNDVFESLLEDIDYYVCECLDTYNLGKNIKKYEIGYCGSYMYGISDVHNFLEALEQTQKTFELLNHDENIYFEKVYAVSKKYNNHYRYSDYIENTLEIAAEKLLEMICRHFKSWYDYIDNEAVFEHYKEYYSETLENNSYFVDEEYNLYKHQIKSYAA